MADESGRFVMVFNGEIYNAPELRAHCERRGHRFRSSMDGEVILHLWEMEGEAALRRLNGIFAVAVLDTVTGELVLARDPLGVKPLFVAEGGGTLWFASEIAALDHMGAPVGGPDLRGLAQFLTFMWIPDPRSPLLGVRSVRPGHGLRWRGGVTTDFRHADPLVARPEEHEVAPPPAAALARFERAVGRQLQADVPVAVMASGGIDSSLVWWAARDAAAHAFCISWDGDSGDENLHEDAAAVRLLESELTTPVTYLEGETLDDDTRPAPSGDLFADPAYELTRMIARRARDEGFKVLLSGQGGDEVLGGYRRHAVTPLLALGHGRRLRAAAARRVAGSLGGSIGGEYLARLGRAFGEGDPFRAYMQLCTYSTAADRARVLGCTEAEVGDDVVWEQHRAVWDSLPEGISLLRRAMALDVAVYLPGLGLAYADRAGMEFGVEIRVPWLDLDLVRWSLTLPDDVLVRWGRGKVLGRSMARHVLPAALARRPKRGFAAPASRVGRVEADRGEHRFRQGRYVAHATDVLRTWAAGRGLGLSLAEPA
jgi:asparagine synthase (glutamine-hydrolysing)